MEKYKSIIQLLFTIFLILLGLGNTNICGQNVKQRRILSQKNDSITFQLNILDSLNVDSLTADSIALQNDSALKALHTPIDTANIAQQADSASILTSMIPNKRFIPNSKKATWLAIIFPGGGQIYNRKYWKLPIFYGGFVGCAYAFNWNSKMYNDYKQAYIDIMDDDPNTKSYENYIPPGYDISGEKAQYQERFKKRKDIFRRQRDLSIFAFIGVYVLSIIDAYVDAELSDFDISNDLGIRIEPTLINNGYGRTSKNIGLQCSITF
ncbi:MAG: DUF5683 domain-containing protein [Phocaeicola sp.]|uniref:DUF5683 domain-containing protein n=1 Tax=Phocaeicola TaxID=909656 RepID=UPI00234F7FC9|nr:DUF5683 domain-containing protein [Phocaeicola oris]MCE2616801.1 DUF5683 domain-containing protein [Phocaeicola oris]